MAVNHEIKSQLAKLLATEDLIVEHKQVDTACFNVHTRVLTLPMWEKASNSVYDMLVGHEVGHALYTPDENWLEKVAIPPQFVNVVEDARIEKLMKRRYAGLAKTFFKGYQELNDEDFFSISDECVADFNLADRANLYFKIGNFVDIIFTADEQVIIDKISNTETFDEALEVAEELYLFCKKEKEEQEIPNLTPPPEVQEGNTQGSSTPTQQQGISEDSGEGSGSSSESRASSQSESDASVSGADDRVDIEPDVKTADSLQDKLQDLVESSGFENLYVEIPKVDLNHIIASNTDIYQEIDRWFDMQSKNAEEGNSIFGPDIFKVADEAYMKFKRSAQKEVGYLVKEFECRKAADSYARATTARTGVLDTSQLHTYKYNEDLFKKVSVIPDGKNHGLIFILDWSGSMSRVLLDTCKQLYNLLWFCKKVSIPFEVYAFSNEWKRVMHGQEYPCSYEKKENLLAVNEEFSLMNLFTSKVNGKTLEHQMLNIWRIAKAYGDNYRSHYSTPTRLGLSGTPLNESLVCLHQILPKFQAENKLQKVQCIVLTDGEANHLPYHKAVKRHWETETYMGTSQLRGGISFLRDRKTGNTYKIPYGWNQFTDLMLTNLRDNFPSVNFIGIRVLEGRDANPFIRLYYDFGVDEYDKIQNDWRKLRSFSIKNSGYHAYFGLSSTSLSQESEFNVDDGASKAKIKSAFVKSLKTKKLNKKVLGEFISLVV